VHTWMGLLVLQQERFDTCKACIIVLPSLYRIQSLPLNLIEFVVCASFVFIFLRHNRFIAYNYSLEEAA
jgi:hypothetical protein